MTCWAGERCAVWVVRLRRPPRGVLDLLPQLAGQVLSGLEQVCLAPTGKEVDQIFRTCFNFVSFSELSG